MRKGPPNREAELAYLKEAGEWMAANAPINTNEKSDAWADFLVQHGVISENPHRRQEKEAKEVGRSNETASEDETAK